MQRELFEHNPFKHLRETIAAEVVEAHGPREEWMKPGIPIIACLSGGKDSTALAILLTKERPAWIGDRPIHYIMNDTGWENPITLAYTDYLRAKLGIEITVPPPKYTFESLAKSRKMFPHARARFCTQELKVFPAARWMDEQGWGDFDAIVARGIRADESPGRRQAQEWGELVDVVNVYHIWNPLVDWTSEQVFDIHARHGIEPNPLYKMGMKRVGCWPCIMASKQQLRASFIVDPDLLPRLRKLEAEVNELAAASSAEKGKSPRPRCLFRADKCPAKYHSHEAISAKGVRFTYPDIDDIYRWAMDDSSPDDPDEEGGCVSMYGLCE